MIRSCHSIRINKGSATVVRVKNVFYPYKIGRFYGAYNEKCNFIRMSVFFLRVKKQDSHFAPYQTVHYVFVWHAKRNGVSGQTT